MVLSCFDVALLMCATAAEPIATNKPASGALVRPASELKRTNAPPASAKSSNQPTVLPRLTNTVDNLSAEFGEVDFSESAVHAERFERMNGAPMVQSRKADPLRFLDRLPLRGGTLFSKNPNARRNPLEVDGW